ncbi:unnamed protein product, partial [Hymenolepis diminuta]
SLLEINLQYVHFRKTCAFIEDFTHIPGIWIKMVVMLQRCIQTNGNMCTQTNAALSYLTITVAFAYLENVISRNTPILLKDERSSLPFCNEVETGALDAKLVVHFPSVAALLAVLYIEIDR